tara:strand:+ start:269 stop:553 length:285 start_codon:yes stop_codon:yes gene_type:complete
MTDPDYRALCARFANSVDLLFSSTGERQVFSERMDDLISLAVETRSALEAQPDPPSLKEQALSELNLTADPDGAELSRTQVELIRQALEALPND